MFVTRMKDIVTGKCDSAQVVTEYSRNGEMGFQLNEERLNQ